MSLSSNKPIKSDDPPPTNPFITPSDRLGFSLDLAVNVLETQVAMVANPKETVQSLLKIILKYNVSDCFDDDVSLNNLLEEIVISGSFPILRNCGVSYADLLGIASMPLPKYHCIEDIEDRVLKLAMVFFKTLFMINPSKIKAAAK